MAIWLVVIIVLSSLIGFFALIILTLVGLRICDYNNNPWGILILFLTLNVVGLIIGIVVIRQNNKKMFNKIDELGLNKNDFLKYYQMKAIDVQKEELKENSKKLQEEIL